MKLIFSFLTCLFFLTSTVHSQDLAQDFISLKEDTPLEICGRTLAINGFYVDNFIAKADIMNFTAPASKPFTGGYKSRDTINISDDCSYIVTSIKKYSIKNPDRIEMKFGGEVLLSKKFIPRDLYLQNPLIMDSDYKTSFGDLIWSVKKITIDTAVVEIKNNIDVFTFNLVKNSIVWFGEDAYYLSNFLAQASNDPKLQWLIEFRKIKDYSFVSGEPITDTDARIDLPAGDSWLIIRKMKYYPKKRIDEQELANTPVKYWVLQVYNYYGGVARPVIEVNTGGVKRFLEYDAYKSFDTEEEVLEFAKINGVKDVVLEEE